MYQKKSINNVMCLIITLIMTFMFTIHTNGATVEVVQPVHQTHVYTNYIPQMIMFNELKTLNTISKRYVTENLNILNNINNTYAEINEIEESENLQIEETNIQVIEEIPIENEIMETSSEIQSKSIKYDFSKVPLSDDLIQAVVMNCEEFNIPIPVALGLIQTESNFDTTAGSKSGCYGLMQLHHKYFNVNTTPDQNIHDGLEYLSRNLSKYGTMMKALNAYNAGHVTGNMKYSNKVMKNAEYWADTTGAPLS